MTETAEIGTERDKLRSYLFDVSGRLDKVLVAAAPVLPKQKISQEQAVAILCRDHPNNEALKTLARLLADLDPLVAFLESELLPAIADGASDLDSVIKREAIVRDDKEVKSEPSKPETEKPAAEPKSELPKPAEQKETPKKKSAK